MTPLNRRKFIVALATCLPAAGSLAAGPKKPDVEYFFSYDCRACFKLAEGLRVLSDQHGFDVKPIPAPLNPKWARFARVYYTAEKLGIPSEFHGQVYRQVQTGPRSVFASDIGAIEFIGSASGVHPDQVGEAFYSEAVKMRVKLAYVQSTALSLQAVPVLHFPDGRLLAPWMTGGVARLITQLKGELSVSGSFA